MKEPLNEPVAITSVNTTPSTDDPVVPNAIDVLPILRLSFCNDEFGTASKLKVNVSDPASAVIFKPPPEPEPKVKLPLVDPANNSAPSKDAVAKA